MASTPEEAEDIDELSEYEHGFLDCALHRMGVIGREPTAEEFSLALFELDDFIREHRQDLDPPLSLRRMADPALYS